MESCPYPVKEGQRYINLNPGRLTHHNISMIYCATKVNEIFTIYGGFIGNLGVGIGFAIFPTVVKRQHKQQRRRIPNCRRVAPQNWLPWQHPLTEVHRILTGSNFFIGGVLT